ncbi:uncharacterized protein LOC124136013 [Haliotis rufescens]|uniref:uncharacterized protein LOC124136013 n=1 Tax=Haliotis rufescens TaxID=6454 RepID=UPI00201FAE99|nr:uncharacterized protein LOC124136013 [Haliotis rufescens]XP_048244643.1 uncharacterized protein LOC124136013 [Haliotis rufescens]XP_048244644.1 uncharacterized protein LOC124136013 [Haliotis rufescens]
MTSSCTNLPPAALNGRMVRNGNIVDYFCAAGFSMTSGDPRATCVSTNTWYPDTPPVCTVIKNTPDDVVPLWVPITCAILLSLIAATCLALACYYCCCRGRCCANYNRIRASTADIHDEGYHDNKGYYGSQQHRGDSYYYDDRYTYTKTDPGRKYDGPYIIPVSNRQRQYPPNRSYVEYITKEPQKPKPKQYGHVPAKVRTTPTSTTPRVDVVHVVQLANGQLVPMDKYLREHPGARLETQGDRDVVYAPATKTDSKPRQAWKANNKRTPPPPVVTSRDYNSKDPVVVTVMNDLNYNHPQHEDKKQKGASKKIFHQPQQPTRVGVVNTKTGVAGRTREDGVKPERDKKDKTSKDLEENKSKVSNDDPPDRDTKDGSNSKKDDDDDSIINNESEPGEPIRAQYLRSGSNLDFDLDLETTNTPPNATKPEFKRHAFAVMDYNRARRAKEFPAWRPHINPVRNINTSTQ